MRHLLFRLLAAAPTATDHISDAELLRRFVSLNDTAAFELIVRRHADAVWAAARHILKNEADAEDAFQASFLALIRKAKQIRAACVGGWLHRVAVHAALKIRERTVRVFAIESAQLDHIPTSPSEQPDAEFAAVVHEELARLSESERLPLVLCDLEGMSHVEAAKALGWPVGTVSGRLSRARAKLRERLARRGLAPTGALLPLLPAPLPLISNALSLTAGAIPPAVLSLTEGVLAMNAAVTWKWIAITAACIGAIGVGTTIGLTQPGGKPIPVPPGAPPASAAKAPSADAKDKPTDADWLSNPEKTSAFPDLKIPEPKENESREERSERFIQTCPRIFGKKAITIDATDDTLRKLLKARLYAGVREMYRFYASIDNGQWTEAYRDQTVECLTDMQAAVLELWGGEPKELIPWLEELVVVAKFFERFTRIRVELGTAPPQNYDRAVRLRFKFEAVLLKAKKRA